MRVNKLKSFTILEALISLILMGVIITLTYALFNVLEKQMFLFEKENTSELQYNLFNTSIKNDIENAHNFNLVDNELLLKSYDDLTIQYRIEDYYILRENSVKTDTFLVHVTSYNLSNTDEFRPFDKTLNITIELLNDTINANYFLKKDLADIINSMYFE